MRKARAPQPTVALYSVATRLSIKQYKRTFIFAASPDCLSAVSDVGRSARKRYGSARWQQGTMVELWIVVHAGSQT
jgi:hypothetical protein